MTPQMNNIFLFGPVLSMTKDIMMRTKMVPSPVTATAIDASFEL